MKIEDYMAIPYQMNGRTIHGADCYGLLVLWFRHELGIELFDVKTAFKEIQAIHTTRLLADYSEKEWIRVRREDVRPHDAVLICNGSRWPNHCGVALDSQIFLQTLLGPGCHAAKIDAWRPRIFGFYRHVKLAGEEQK